MTLATDLASRSQTLGENVIAALSPAYSNGIFWQSNMSEYHRMGLPGAALMATLSRHTTSAERKQRYIAMIEEIINFSIDTNTNTLGFYTDGATDLFGWYGQYPDRQGMTQVFAYSANTTIEQIADMAWTIWQLPPGSIASSTIRRWTSFCQSNCSLLDNWIDGNKITTYYINGNYQAQLLGAYWFTSLISRGAKKAYYQDCYERALNFMVQPYVYKPIQFPSPWGLTIDVSGSENDWSDFQAHLTETNTRVLPGPDFDWNYSCTQMDAMARVFLQNRDSRLIRYINAISNKVEPRLNSGTWILNGAGGSRTANTQQYANSWLEVTAMLGQKSSNTSYLSSVNTLARWDNGVIGEVMANSSNGNMTGGRMAWLRSCIAPVRAAAAISIENTVP